VGCALIGGETAEMPDMYARDEYDLAGFIVGVVERDRLLDGSRIEPGDRLIGLPSLGLHTNGFSLARRLFFDRLGLGSHDRIPELDGTVADLLLRAHRSYYGCIEPILDRSLIRGMAHITGGGITDNLPRILPEGTAARVVKGSWPVLPLFRFIQEKGSIDDAEMYRTFNMGIGMILVAGRADCDPLRTHFARANEPCYVIGEVVSGPRSVEYVE
jgi:phosphoribosylformylglycinamidine cyclo-ligase